jgi:hypothetical protein
MLLSVGRASPLAKVVHHGNRWLSAMRRNHGVTLTPLFGSSAYEWHAGILDRGKQKKIKNKKYLHNNNKTALLTSKLIIL